jgi:hypothetical protein
MSPWNSCRRVCDELRKLAAARMRHEAAGQPRVHVADESSSRQRTLVSPNLRTYRSSAICCGPIGRRAQANLRNLLRSAPPKRFRVEAFSASVTSTDAPNHVLDASVCRTNDS